MHPSSLAQFFEDFANLLQIRGNEEDSFPILAYRRAAEIFRDYEGDILGLIAEGKLHTIQGIGKRIEEKAKELTEKGKVKEYEDLKKEVPESLLDVLRVPFLGPKKAAQLFHELKVKDLPSLKKALESGKAQMLPRFGKKTADKLLKGIDMLSKTEGRTLLGNAFLIVNDLIDALKKCKDITKMEVAGSFRRREETVGDIDILVIASDRSTVASFVTKLPDVTDVLGKGDTKVSVRLNSGLQVDVRMIEEESWGAALQYFTGSKAHNVALRSYAKEKKMKVSEYGVFRVKETKESKGTKESKEECIAGETEEEVYKALGMSFIPPELRQNSGELEAALNNELPDLITLDDIKGDLHMHSTWSDGKNSILEMAKAAEKLGYEYICIADHSPSLAMIGGPKTAKDIEKKQKEIVEAQKKTEVKILCGTEVDILADGKLDYPDEILEMFDVVIAAIHSGFDRDNTDRLLAGIEHPLVHCIAHPTGRHIGKRNAYPFDEDLIYKKAAETGTWLEIDAHPVRLDLPFSMVRKAKENGTRFMINTDAHHTKDLNYMHFGVSVARRGWLTKGDFVNTASLDEFMEQTQS